MILDRLELRNFKRFRHAEIDFKDGITGIIGNNGTGKSSLVTAVLFALYGVKGTGISGDYIVSGFAGPKDKCEVALDFRIGGDTYRIIRTFRKGKTVTHDAELYKNKKLLAKEVSPVEEAVRLAVGMGPTDFRNTIYAAQKDLLTLLDNTPAKRKEWFLRALGIDYLNTESQKILKDRIDAGTGELLRKEGELAALAGRLSGEDLAKREAAAASLTRAIAEHEGRRTALAKQRDELDARLKALDEKKLAHTRLLQQQQAERQELASETARVKKLEAALALLADEEAEYRQIEKTAGSYAAARERLDALAAKKAGHAGIAADIGFAEREIRDLDLRAAAARERLASLEKDAAERARICGIVRQTIAAGPDIADDRLDSATSYRLHEIAKQAGTLAARLQQYAAEREKMVKDRDTIRSQGPDGTCPLCRQKLGAHAQDLEREFAATLEALEDRSVADLEKQERLAKEKEALGTLLPLIESLRAIDGRLKMRDGHEKELADLQARRRKKEEERSALAESLALLGYDEQAYRAAVAEAEAVQKAQARFIELGKKIAQAATMKQQRAELLARIAKREEDLARQEKEAAALAYDPAKTAGAEAELAAIDRNLRDTDIAIATAAKDRKFAEEKIAEFRRAEDEIGAIRKQVQDLEGEIADLKLTRALIAEFVVYLMQVVRSRIEGEVSRIIAEITGGRYEQVLLDADFNLLVRDIDSDYPVERFSGGEQDDIAVALRIALSRYLAELHNVHESTFLIFDEIFGSQDEERRANLLTALRTQESRFPQILLISHIAEIQGEFANTLVVEPGTDGASRIREAE